MVLMYKGWLCAQLRNYNGGYTEISVTKKGLMQGRPKIYEGKIEES